MYDFLLVVNERDGTIVSAKSRYHGLPFWYRLKSNAGNMEEVKRLLCKKCKSKDVDNNV